jgi:hypothetical protein
LSILIKNDATPTVWRIAMQSVRQIDFDELDAALQSTPALSMCLFRKVVQGMHKARIPSPVGEGDGT